MATHLWEIYNGKDSHLPFKHEPHAWQKFKRLPWEYCKRCGLVGLHNALTAWCIKQGCNNREHPDFRRKVQELTHDQLRITRGLSPGASKYL